MTDPANRRNVLASNSLAVLQFCKTPRTVREIYERFSEADWVRIAMANLVRRRHLKNLTPRHKPGGTYVASRIEATSMQKYWFGTKEAHYERIKEDRPGGA